MTRKQVLLAGMLSAIVSVVLSTSGYLWVKWPSWTTLDFAKAVSTDDLVRVKDLMQRDDEFFLNLLGPTVYLTEFQRQYAGPPPKSRVADVLISNRTFRDYCVGEEHFEIVIDSARIKFDGPIQLSYPRYRITCTSARGKVTTGASRIEPRPALLIRTTSLVDDSDRIRDPF